MVPANHEEKLLGMPHHHASYFYVQYARALSLYLSQSLYRVFPVQTREELMYIRPRSTPVTVIITEMSLNASLSQPRVHASLSPVQTRSLSHIQSLSLVYKHREEHMCIKTPDDAWMT
jgi:hypothetical protein